jgi:PhnB protein
LHVLFSYTPSRSSIGQTVRPRRYLKDGPVALYASDEPPFRCEGIMLALLGTAAPATLSRWFSRLARGGQVVDDLQKRSWGASDGRVVDRYALHWLIGFESQSAD